MNKAVLFSLLVCVLHQTLARPQQNAISNKEPVQIINQENQASVDGSFHFGYESADGTKVSQDGILKDAVDEEGKPTKAESLNGEFSYTDADGQVISIRYVADENGYRPEGAHLPTPPPIPEAIQRSLDFLATAKPQPN